MLHLHRAERADRLVAALAELLAEPLADPFTPEVIAVPTRGMERWLTQRLSASLGRAAPGAADGVCANVDFPSPRALVEGAVAAATGIDASADPWRPERVIWPLLEEVEESLDEPWLAELAHHLGAGGDELRRARRLSTVRHLGELYDSYALNRPGLVLGWARERQPAGHWQAELWRRLRRRIGTPSPAERAEAAAGALRADPASAGLPGRVALFGLTRVPAAHLEILRVLGSGIDVHLLLLHPSPAMWARVAEATRGEPVVRRAADFTAALPAGRLLASWGRDARELQLALAAGAGAVADHHHAQPAQEPSTLLARLQEAIRRDEPAPGEPLPGRTDERPVLAPGDRSVQIHACHGRARQVEVIRDAVLHELARDPSLEPRDVIVMCPDIETFAPLIHATFGAGQAEGEDDERDDDPVAAADRLPPLRVRLADRSLRQVNPVLGVVARLVELAGQRLTASQVIDFADREPVRRRLRLDDDDVARLEDWISETGIRWGLDAPHRAPFKLDRLAAGTFRAGLDRLLAGVAMTEDGGRMLGDVLPMDDVESGAIDLAGRFAEYVDRLRAAIDSLTDPKPIAAWAQAIATSADALTAVSPGDAWQRSELQRILDAVVDEATTGGVAAQTALTLPEVRALLAGRLQGRPTRANFRTGHLTVCTLVPMRSVPHRVVCLLGLDDAAFPRRAARDGDDLLLSDPHVGDRDPRAEDRQQLLDALMAAGERLIVTFTGNDERNNAPRPPAVPVGELLDVVDQTVRCADGEPAREAVLTRHPLQPFDPRSYTGGELMPATPWSFDRVGLEGARALSGPRMAREPFLPGPLAPVAEPVLELQELVRFAERPARAFLRRRLGIGIAEFSDEMEDALPIELDPLESWQVAQRVLEARLGGADVLDALQVEMARGALPPGELARPVVRAIRPVVEAIAAAAEQLAGGDVRPQSRDVRLVLGDGRLLSGTVGGLCGDLLLHAGYSRVSPRHRLATWVRWLALTAAHPEEVFAAATVGRRRADGDDHAVVTIARLAPPARPEERAAFARAQLDRLLELHDRNLRRPLPVFCLTSAAYAAAAHRGADPHKAARAKWESAWKREGEQAEPEHRLILGSAVAYDDLLAEPAGQSESGDGWASDEPSRFGRHARRLWEGLLAAEVLEDR